MVLGAWTLGWRCWEMADLFEEVGGRYLGIYSFVLKGVDPGLAGWINSLWEKAFVNDQA